MKNKIITLTESELHSIVKRTVIKAINEISDELQQRVYDKRRDNVLKANKNYRDKQKEMDNLRDEINNLRQAKYELTQAGPDANAKGLFKNLPGNKRKRREEYDRELDDLDTRIEQARKRYSDTEIEAKNIAADSMIAYDKYENNWRNNKNNPNSKVDTESFPTMRDVNKDNLDTQRFNNRSYYDYDFNNKADRQKQKRSERLENRKKREQQKLDDYINNLD